MKIIASALVAFAAAGLVAARAATSSSTESLTPAQQKIELARKRIAGNPARFEGHNDLAMALARRARETADPGFYVQAANALAESRRLSPGNLDADKVEAWVLLGQHEFGKALDKAKAINRRVPDDLMTYGMLVDAYVELGRYAEAEEAAQWMLNLRPGTMPGLTRAAYLRELFGDVEGALQLMVMAIEQVHWRETEERAWILTQMSHLHLLEGRVERAQSLAEDALRLFPGYHYALNALAKVYERRGDHTREAALQADRYRVAPHPENMFEWAAALQRAGRRQEAHQKFVEFERAARAEMSGPDNANRELAQYYTDYAGRPAEAVRIMQNELTRRGDLGTRSTYAWALWKAGRRTEARKQIAEVLAVGTTDPTIRKYAAVIQGRARSTASR
jgi:tetratricopeptide (TPR) repeat protein